MSLSVSTVSQKIIHTVKKASAPRDGVKNVRKNDNVDIQHQFLHVFARDKSFQTFILFGALVKEH